MMTGYIIRMKGVDLSEELAQDCADSLEKHGVNYEFFDAVHGEEIDKVWTEKGLDFYRKQNANKRLPGVKGCFLSHYILWEKCLALDTPILIFEHDALLIKDLPDLVLKNRYDVLNLDYASRVEKDYEAHLQTNRGVGVENWPVAPKKKGLVSQLNKSSIKGIHAYAIKPSGAAQLIHKAQTLGTLPADIHVNSKYIDLRYSITSYARINPKYWLNAKQGSLHSFTRAKD